LLLWDLLAGVILMPGVPDKHYWPSFLRRRLGVQASQGPGRPGRLANPRLIRFPFISPIFSHFSLIWRRLALPYTRLGVSKGTDRLTSPCRLKNIATGTSRSQGNILLNQPMRPYSKVLLILVPLGVSGRPGCRLNAGSSFG
jgi:hypothetical protein